MKADTLAGWAFALGFLLVNFGAALDKASLVLAGFFYVWLAVQLGEID
jgi:hypothetical protein